MTLQTSATPNNDDLDKADRNSKLQIIVWVLAALLIAAVTWGLFAQNNNSQIKASSEASQKFTLAQQVAAACAIKEQADDLGGLCASANQIVKEGPVGSAGVQGPPGDVGAQGPLGPKGEDGSQGIQGVMGAQGIQGIFGKTGDQGIAGAPGVNGSDGSNGVAGPAGVAGVDGAAGAEGLVGPAGATGATGAEGPVGAPGATGATGAIGPAGQSAFPFTFVFTVSNRTFTCTLTAPDVLSSCVTN